MRTLVIGAGAVGGYFGGRLLQARRDVTFLVRQGRAGEVAASGLHIRSACGDATIAAPPTVLTGDLAHTLDLTLLSFKDHDPETTISSMTPAADTRTEMQP